MANSLYNPLYPNVLRNSPQVKRKLYNSGTPHVSIKGSPLPLTNNFERNNSMRSNRGSNHNLKEFNRGLENGLLNTRNSATATLELEPLMRASVS